MAPLSDILTVELSLCGYMMQFNLDAMQPKATVIVEPVLE